MTATPLALDDLDLVSNETFADNGYPHDAWARLRRESPLHHFSRGVKVPFWAVTKHEDIVWISRQPRRLLNAPRLAVFPEFAPPEEDERIARHLLNMDAPDHSEYRKLASAWFTPRAVRRLQPAIEQISTQILDELCRDGEVSETDFVTSVAAPLPLAVLAELLGVPREDWKLMFEWTNAIVGSQDPEYQRGENAQQSTHATRACRTTGRRRRRYRRRSRDTCSLRERPVCSRPSDVTTDRLDQLPLDKRVNVLVCPLQELRLATPTLENGP